MNSKEIEAKVAELLRLKKELAKRKKRIQDIEGKSKARKHVQQVIRAQKAAHDAAVQSEDSPSLSASSTGKFHSASCSTSSEPALKTKKRASVSFTVEEPLAGNIQDENAGTYSDMAGMESSSKPVQLSGCLYADDATVRIPDGDASNKPHLCMLEADQGGSPVPNLDDHPAALSTLQQCEVDKEHVGIEQNISLSSDCEVKRKTRRSRLKSSSATTAEALVKCTKKTPGTSEIWHSISNSTKTLPEQLPDPVMDDRQGIFETQRSHRTSSGDIQSCIDMEPDSQTTSPKKVNLDAAFIEMDSCPADLNRTLTVGMSKEQSQPSQFLTSDLEDVIPDTQFMAGNHSLSILTSGVSRSLQQHTASMKRAKRVKTGLEKDNDDMDLHAAESQSFRRSVKTKRSGTKKRHAKKGNFSKVESAPVSSNGFTFSPPFEVKTKEGVSSQKSGYLEAESENLDVSANSRGRSKGKTKNRQSALSLLDFSFLQEEASDLYSQVKMRRRKSRSSSPAGNGQQIGKVLCEGSSQLVGTFSQEGETETGTCKNSIVCMRMPSVKQGLSQISPHKEAETLFPAGKGLWPPLPKNVMEFTSEFSVPAEWLPGIKVEKATSKLRHQSHSYSEELPSTCQDTSDSIDSSVSEPGLRRTGRGIRRGNGTGRRRGQGRRRTAPSRPELAVCSSPREDPGRTPQPSTYHSTQASVDQVEDNPNEKECISGTPSKSRDAEEEVEGQRQQAAKSSLDVTGGRMTLARLEPLQLEVDDSIAEDAVAVVSIDIACSGDRSILACCSSHYLWLHYLDNEEWRPFHRYTASQADVLHRCLILDNSRLRQGVLVVVCAQQGIFVLVCANLTGIQHVRTLPVHIPLDNSYHELTGSPCFSTTPPLICSLDAGQFCVALETEDLTVLTLHALSSDFKNCEMVLELESVSGGQLHSLNPARGQPGALIALSTSEIYIWSYRTGLLLTTVDTKLTTLQCLDVWAESGLLFLPCVLDPQVSPGQLGCMLVVNPTSGRCCVVQFWQQRPAVLRREAQGKERLVEGRLRSCCTNGKVVCAQTANGGIVLWSLSSGCLLVECIGMIGEEAGPSPTATTVALHPHTSSICVASGRQIQFYMHE